MAHPFWTRLTQEARRFAAAQLFCALSLLVIACGEGSEVASEGTQLLSTESVPGNVQPNEQDDERGEMAVALRAAFIKSRQADAGVEFSIRQQGNVPVATNTRHRMMAEFNDDAVRLMPIAEEAKWTAELRLERISRGDISKRPSAATASVEGNRVEYRRANVTEWWVNGPLGLEQGATLGARPDGEGTEPVELQFFVGDGLQPQKVGADSLVLNDANGGVALRAHDLIVLDENGKVLSSHFKVTENAFSIVFDDSDALYPVEVDPVWTQVTKILPGAGPVEDDFGASVSMDGDTAVVGAPLDEAAYVFVWGGSSWVEQATLTSSDEEAAGRFGSAVSIDGDTVVVGADNEGGHGSAHVFVRSGVTWSHQQEIGPFGGAADDKYGAVVSISGDTAVIGAEGDNDKGLDAGAAYVFFRSGDTWALQRKLTASDGVSGDFFGCAVAAQNDTVVVGAEWDRDAGVRAGAVYVFVRSGGTWSEHQKLTPSDGVAHDNFGRAVSISGDTLVSGANESAYVFTSSGGIWNQWQKLVVTSDDFGNSVDIDDDTLVVGAWSDDETALHAGAAYVFVSSGGIWNQQQKLTAADGKGSDYLGVAVSVSGERVIAGAFRDDDNGLDSGSGYIFQRSGGTWTVQQEIHHPGHRGNYSQLGSSVAVDGDTAVVGGEYNEKAYVYVRDGGAWTQQAVLTASDGGDFTDNFGCSVSVNGDTILVGSKGDADYGDSSGSAYVFVRSGLTWNQQQKLSTPDGMEDDYFGAAVSLDGNTAVIGAYGDDDKGTSAGSAYIYVRAVDTWTLQQKITAADGWGGDYFGLSVSVSGDTAVVGAHGDDDKGSYSGSAYVFVRTGVTWSQQQKLTATDGAADDHFGESVSVSGDTTVIGARYDDDISSASGSAYVFVRTGVTWNQQQKLYASDGVTADAFGDSVSVNGDTAIVGSMYDDDNGPSSGSAYIFLRTGVTWSERHKFTASDGLDNDQFGAAVAVTDDTVVVGAPLDDDKGSSSGSAYLFELLGLNGDVCTGDSGCSSGYCVDNVCCDTQCGAGVPDDCLACSVATGAAVNGTCAPVNIGAPCGDQADDDCLNPNTCNASGTCQSNDEIDGTVCSDDGNDCTSDECLGGVCNHPDKSAGAFCGSDTITDCDNRDVCDGAGVCLDNLEVDGTSCTDDGSDCTSDECQAGVCAHTPVAAGTACGDPGSSDCTQPDSCDGAGVCQPNNETDGTVCSDDGNECTDDSCQTGVCSHAGKPAGIACGSGVNTDCDNADTCDGAGTCLPNLEPTGFACGSSVNTDCDNADTCDGAGTCLPNLEAPGFACGSSTSSECDNPDSCDGAGMCLSNHETDGATCTDDGNDCTTDVCQAGGCSHPPLSAGVACGSSMDTVCDNPDSCDGAGSCAANYESSAVPCRAAVGLCDADDYCDGAGSCSADQKLASECRPSNGDCDPAESCDGVNDNCPTNVQFVSGESCDDSNSCTHTDGCQAGGICSGIAYSCASESCLARNCDGLGGCIETPEPTTVECDTEACPSHYCEGSAIWHEYEDSCTKYCDGAGSCEATCECTPSDTICTAGGCCESACADATGCYTTPGACAGLDVCTTNTLNIEAACEGCGLEAAAGTCGGSTVYECSDSVHAECLSAMCGGSVYYCTDVTGDWEWHADASCDDGNLCTYSDECGGSSCSGTPLQCDDENCLDRECNGTDTCDEITLENGEPCDDGDPLTIDDVCGPGGVCSGTVEGDTDVDTGTGSDDDTDSTTAGGDDDTDSDATGCEADETQCNGDMVESCDDGEWSVWDDCAVQGMICTVIQGEAQCAGGSGDTDSGPDDSANGTSSDSCGCSNVGVSGRQSLFQVLFSVLLSVF